MLPTDAEVCPTHECDAYGCLINHRIDWFLLLAFTGIFVRVFEKETVFWPEWKRHVEELVRTNGAAEVSRRTPLLCHL